MGECGCGNFYGDFKFPGPKGTTYSLSLYRPCRDCNTPAGIIITKHTDKDDIFDIKGIPHLKFNEYKEACIPVFSPKKFKEEMISIFKGAWEGESIDEYAAEVIAEDFNMDRILFPKEWSE